MTAHRIELVWRTIGVRTTVGKIVVVMVVIIFSMRAQMRVLARHAVM